MRLSSQAHWTQRADLKRQKRSSITRENGTRSRSVCSVITNGTWNFGAEGEHPRELRLKTLLGRWDDGASKNPPNDKKRIAEEIPPSYSASHVTSSGSEA